MFRTAAPAFVFALPLALLAQTPTAVAAPSAPPTANVVFLHWNDFHGQFRPQQAVWKVRPGQPTDNAPRIGGAAAMAGFVRAEREAAAKTGARVVATDAGDWYQGTLEGNDSKGRLAVQFLAQLRPDAMVLGNHEYDFGPQNVADLVAILRSQQPPIPVLAANLVVAGAKARTQHPEAQPFAVVDLHGLKLVIVGLITRDTKAVSTGPWGDAGFEDEIAAVRTVLPSAQQAGDVVVLLTHCGLETDIELAKAFPQIPLILGGHSHTGIKEPVVQGSTWIVQTHGKASEISRVQAHADVAGKRLQMLSGQLVELDPKQHPDDPETAAWIAEQTRELAAKWDVPVGTLESPAYEDRGARSTPIGNLVAEVFREAGGAELGFTNKGGLRTRLAAGPLTRRQIYELLPFDNTLVSLTLTGAQLRAILRGSLGKGRRPLEIGGGSYRYTERDGERVLLEVMVGGVPLDDARGYRVATSSFLARGGDGLSAFADGKDVKDHGVLLRDVLIARIEQDKVLRADGGNRIEFVQEAK